MPAAYGQAKTEMLDEPSEKALRETQELMTNPEQRQAAIEKSPSGKAADQRVKNLLGGDKGMTDEVYALAAEVFGQVVKDANGDPQKMEAMMTEFQRDPASFAKSWTPEQQAKLKALANKIGRPTLGPR